MKLQTPSLVLVEIQRIVCYTFVSHKQWSSLMFDIGFFELLIIMGIAVVVIGPQNLPRLAKSIGKGWGEFQSTFNDLKKDVMDEAEGLRQSTDIDKLEQDIGAATKVDVDVNLSMNDINYDPKPSDQEKS